MISVVLAGGGTAGHIEPALNVADALRRMVPDAQITALGTERGLEGTLVPQRGYALRMIPAVPLPRRPGRDLLTIGPQIRRATRASEDVLADVAADVVIGFGGYVALPAYLAARRRHTPLVIHEANARAGLANRVGSRFTHHVAEAVAGSLPHARRVGIPLRRQIATLDRQARREEALRHFGFDSHGPTLLVFGGSQGAMRINTAMTLALPTLLAAGVQVLHIVGPRHELPSVAPGSAYRPVGYVDRMDLAYAAADLAVCRAGAMTCAELAAVGLPAIYVPLPIGNGEQRLNAQPIVESGGGLLVDDADLTGEVLAEVSLALVTSAVQLQGMSVAAARLGVRDADDILAKMVLEAGGHSRV